MLLGLPILLVLTRLGAGPPGSLSVEPTFLRLDGPASQAQLVVSGQSRDTHGRPNDLTLNGDVSYESLDPRIAQVSGMGVVEPRGNGETSLRIRLTHGPENVVKVRVVVDHVANPRPVRFSREVVPILTKRGCNAGVCHGKAAGQNGFRLSLLGADAQADFDHIVHENQSRRVSLLFPDSSLILRKPSAQILHGGGKRLDENSKDFLTIERWIRQGVPHVREPSLASLTVWPDRRLVARKGVQQLRVAAHFDNGEEADVTRLAQFQSSDDDLAEVDQSGRVTAKDHFGQAAVMARFGGLAAVSRFIIPLGASIPEEAFLSPRNFVDTYIDAQLTELGLPPSPPCTEAEFARRSSLDLCGILPTPEAISRLDGAVDADIRVKWIERLLDRPEHADREAMSWSAILRNKRTLGPLSQAGSFAFHAWIRQAFAENMPYDRFAAAILTATGDAAINPPVIWYRQVNTLEAQVDDTSQLFLGVRLQCARCHHHPYERWGQEDYFGYAAFFSRIGRKAGPDSVTPRIFVLAQGEATDPSTGRSYQPRYLSSSEAVDLAPGADPRDSLVGWFRRPDNPFFARAIVNRCWKQLFGRGLVEPEDDLRASNPSTHPELLDALAADFIGHGFNMKRLFFILATSRAYERSSEPNAWNRLDRQAYSRFLPRRLPGEVLLDAINTVTNTRSAFPRLPRGIRAVQLPDEGFDTRERFLETFGRPRRESVCECERSSEPSLSQSLQLINSAEIEQKIKDPAGRAASLAALPGLDSEKIDQLYRVALSRLPSELEQTACMDLLNRKRSEGKAVEGFEDLIWTLINTKEFLFIQ